MRSMLYSTDSTSGDKCGWGGGGRGSIWGSADKMVGWEGGWGVYRNCLIKNVIIFVHQLATIVIVEQFRMKIRFSSCNYE